MEVGGGGGAGGGDVGGVGGGAEGNVSWGDDCVCACMRACVGVCVCVDAWQGCVCVCVHLSRHVAAYKRTSHGEGVVERCSCIPDANVLWKPRA